MTEEGRRNVYVRTTGIGEDKVEALTDELEKRFVVLYTGRDFLDEIERRRVRIPY